MASTAIIENGSISANIRFPDGYSLNSDMTINGNVSVNGRLLVNGYTLTVNDLEVCNTYVTLNRGGIDM